MESNGWNMSIAIEADQAEGAHVVMADNNAVEDAAADAAGFATPENVDCTVLVEDFCLISADEISAGRFEFNFTIRVESNSKCGTLSASMDLIQDTTFLGQVDVSSEAIIDAFDCDCTNTFSIQADYDGVTPGDIYGQLDIVNTIGQIIQITDSCVLPMPNA